MTKLGRKSKCKVIRMEKLTEVVGCGKRAGVGGREAGIWVKVIGRVSWAGLIGQES